MIPWNEINFFNKNEFPADPDIYAEPEVIISLNEFRRITGRKIYPSPLKRAFVRLGDEDVNSQHYCAPDFSIKSRAIDVFPEGNPFKNWLNAVSCGLWGGVGVYFGTFYGTRTNLWPMLHLDIRCRDNGVPALWYRNPSGEYDFFMRRDTSAIDVFFRMFSAYGLLDKQLKRRK